MSLLSDLLNHTPPNVNDARDRSMPKRVPDRPRLLLAVPTQSLSGAYVNAANASAEWRQARNQYISHVMSCQGCYAPTGRHCPAGADLRVSYDATPMEPHA